MDKNILGQTQPISRVISALDSKLYPPLKDVQDFLDPLGLYSLYCIIAKKRPCNEKPDPKFRPFEKTREYSEALEGFEDYKFWVRTLEDFLGESLIYSNSTHKAKLTAFGAHMYPVLMNIFLNLYGQNEALESFKASWEVKRETSIFL